MVHDAALNAGERMFSQLPDTGHFHAGEAESEEMVERHGQASFYGGGAAHTGADGNISRDDAIEPFHIIPLLLQMVHNTFQVIDPIAARFDVFEGERFRFPVKEGVGVAGIGIVEGDGVDDTFINGGGQNEAFVIVRMFSDEVDPSGELTMRGSRLKRLRNSAVAVAIIIRVSFTPKSSKKWRN